MRDGVGYPVAVQIGKPHGVHLRRPGIAVIPEAPAGSAVERRDECPGARRGDVGGRGRSRDGAGLPVAPDHDVDRSVAIQVIECDGSKARAGSPCLVRPHRHPGRRTERHGLSASKRGHNRHLTRHLQDSYVGPEIAQRQRRTQVSAVLPRKQVDGLVVPQRNHIPQPVSIDVPRPHDRSAAGNAPAPLDAAGLRRHRDHSVPHVRRVRRHPQHLRPAVTVQLREPQLLEMSLERELPHGGAIARSEWAYGTKALGPGQDDPHPSVIPEIAPHRVDLDTGGATDPIDSHPALAPLFVQGNAKRGTRDGGRPEPDHRSPDTHGPRCGEGRRRRPKQVVVRSGDLEDPARSAISASGHHALATGGEHAKTGRRQAVDGPPQRGSDAPGQAAVIGPVHEPLERPDHGHRCAEHLHALEGVNGGGVVSSAHHHRYPGAPAVGGPVGGSGIPDRHAVHHIDERDGQQSSRDPRSRLRLPGPATIRRRRDHGNQERGCADRPAVAGVDEIHRGEPRARPGRRSGPLGPAVRRDQDGVLRSHGPSMAAIDEVHAGQLGRRSGLLRVQPAPPFPVLRMVPPAPTVQPVAPVGKETSDRSACEAEEEVHAPSAPAGEARSERMTARTANADVAARALTCRCCHDALE